MKIYYFFSKKNLRSSSNDFIWECLSVTHKNKITFAPGGTTIFTEK